MSLQTVIDFESAMLRRHNNSESQAQAMKSSVHFMSQTEWVLRQLISGRVVSSQMARDEFGIEDVRARIHELKLNGIEVLHSVIPGSHGKRQWYLNAEEIKRLKRVKSNS